ncbi:MAG: dihydroorotase [Calothrix sp. MO_192.B10]|nr:dihydroorotase [Calothrix sp. MO_192.B10]
MVPELLQQVRLIDPVSATDSIVDVLIIDNYIQSIANGISDIPDNTQIRDCRGLILGTGLVDLYSHSGEPGFEERETLSSLYKAAISGGFTRITILPDTSPPIDNPAVVAQLQKSKADTNNSHPLPLLYIWGAVSQAIAGENMAELVDLATAGVVGFTDSQPWKNLTMVRRLLEYLQPLNKPVAFWCCDRQLASNGIMREGYDSIRLGLPGNPAYSETTAIANLIELVAATKTPVHIMRVSTERSVKLILTAKEQGLPITASTTWMHLLLDTTAVQSYDPSLHLEPPLGNPQDMEALRKAVKTGIIDAIAIDHSPYTYEEKTVSFAEAPPGAIGLELALPLLWQNLVETGEFTALELWGALSSHPAQCLQQTPSTIAPGEKAEMTLFNPQQTWNVEGKNLHTLSSNTPWLGKQLTGKVLQTWCFKG